MKRCFLTFFLFLFQTISWGSTPEECAKFAQGLPSDYRTASIEVPIDWSQPNGPKTTVFYFTNFENGQIPVVYFNGGPLGYDHFSYSVFSSKTKLRNLGFIYIDQRGTGCSEKIPPVTDLKSAENASLYAADQIVFDAEAIRKLVVGKRPWKVFGQSYGGQIANRYLSLAGENIISIHNYAGGFNSFMPDFFAKRMVKQNKVTEAFFNQYPNLLSVFQKLQATLSDSHCITHSSRKICGIVLLDMAMDELYSLNNWPQFAANFSRLLLNDQPNLPLFKSYSTYLLDYFFSSQFLISQTVWAQEAQSSNSTFDLVLDCDFADAILRNQGIDPNSLLVNHCRIIRSAVTKDISNFLNQILPKIKIRENSITSNDFKNLLKAHSHVKYFVYTGGLDFYDTIETDMNQFTSNSQFSHTHFKEQDHYGYFVEETFWDEFLK
jgi:pimeloyl-ACP methyl ester carboxylesterase